MVSDRRPSDDFRTHVLDDGKWTACWMGRRFWLLRQAIGGRDGLPYTAYFVGGLVASLSAKRRHRIYAAIAAHLIPLVTFWFADKADSKAFAIMYVVTFAGYAAAWRQMLKK